MGRMARKARRGTGRWVALMGLTFVVALGLALLIKGLGVVTLLGGILIGLVVAIAFIVTNTLSEYLYSGASLKLFWIHAGYRVVYILIMGAILGVWQ